MSFLLSSAALNAIPDSGLLHRYDWREASGTSTVTDQEGSADLTGSYTGLAGSINGITVGRFDGSDDYLDTDFANLTEPYDIYIVFQARSNPDNSYILDGLTSAEHMFYMANSQWNFYQGSPTGGGSLDTSAHVATTRWSPSGQNDILRLDGSQVFAGDAGSSSSTGLTVGANGDRKNHSPIDVGWVGVYDPSASGYSVTGVESYLTSEFNF